MKEMKEYVAPHYNCEVIESNDVILTSSIQMAELVEKSEFEAQVSVSAFDVLGLR